MAAADDRLPDRMPWVARAACHGRDTEPPAELCASCLVRLDCLEYALRYHYSLRGMFGGHGDEEREQLLLDHAGDIRESLIASSKLHAVTDSRARHAAMIRHPSASPDTREQLRAQLKLDFDA